jgi:hypothetical protein
VIEPIYAEYAPALVALADRLRAVETSLAKGEAANVVLDRFTVELLAQLKELKARVDALEGTKS